MLPMHTARRAKQAQDRLCTAIFTENCRGRDTELERTRGSQGDRSPSQPSKPTQRPACGMAWIMRAMAGLSRPNMRGPDRPAARRSAPARCSTSFHARPGWSASTGMPPSTVTLLHTHSASPLWRSEHAWTRSTQGIARRQTSVGQVPKPSLEASFT